MSDPNQLKADLAINPADINGEMVRQPALYAYYSDVLRRKQAELKKAKLDLDVFEAALDNKIRDLAAAKGEKVTEAQIGAKIKLNNDWYQRKQRVLDLETACDQLDSVVWSFVHKKDMLVSLGANQRQERNAITALGGMAGNVTPFPGDPAALYKQGNG